MGVATDILFAIWFMLPAAAANAAPIFAARLPLLDRWDTPIDFGRRFHGKPILGPHKTWRGIVSGIVVATFVLWAQQILSGGFESLRIFTNGVDYPTLPTLLLGPLFGLGALGGDAVKSFFKRRHGTPSGESWLPFDQLDYIIGAIIVSLPFVVLTIRQYLLVLVIWFVAHLASTYAGWKVGLKAKPV